MRFVTILLFLINLFFSLPVYAATYYISPTGNDTMGNGRIDNPWNTLRKGISVLRAGDTLYCRGGIYTKVDDMAGTAVSGTSGSRITVMNYPGETPVFRTHGVLTGYSYIFTVYHGYWIFDGLEFRPTDTAARSGNNAVWFLYYGGHTIIRNCVVEGIEISGEKYSFNLIIQAYSNYNEFYNNTFSKAGTFKDATGDRTGPDGYIIQLHGASSYNKIHNNNLGYGCHDVIGIYGTGQYNEIYSNTITHSLGYGVYINNDGKYNLVQGNNITGCNEYPVQYSKMPIYNKGSNNIFRRNVGWNNVWNGQGFQQDGYNSSNNHIYNNVFYNNVNVGMLFQNLSATTTGNKIYNNVLAKNGSIQEQYKNKEISSVAGNFFDNAYANEIKNNYIVAYQSGAWKDDWTSIFYSTGPTFSPYGEKKVSKMEANFTGVAKNIYNYCDPKFVNTATGDFTIQSGSCLIDAGRHLTTANGSGTNSTALIVYDAGFFWPGDNIRIGGVTATISSINYATNTITLSSPKIWNHVDNVDLDYKGIAPDIGAFEYGFNLTPTPPSPPKNLRVVP